MPLHFALQSGATVSPVEERWCTVSINLSGSGCNEERLEAGGETLPCGCWGTRSLQIWMQGRKPNLEYRFEKFQYNAIYHHASFDPSESAAPLWNRHAWMTKFPQKQHPSQCRLRFLRHILSEWCFSFQAVCHPALSVFNAMCFVQACN